MHINQVNATAAELYEVDQSFVRFNQKNNLIIKSLWDAEIKKLEQIRKDNFEQHVKAKKPGYSKFENAFLAGCLNKIDYGVNICDQEANAWNGKKGVKDEEMERTGLTRAIKKAAKMFGASVVGIAQLDRRWVYSQWFDLKTGESYPLKFSDEAKEYQNVDQPTLLDNGIRVIPANMNTVIVLLYEMDYECLKHAPTLLAYANSCHVYQMMSLGTQNLAGLIRELGYNAIPSLNCTALNIPLAIDAGLGQIGRNGKLINPYLGTRIRIAKVITDLPLDYDRPIDFGVNQFCNACRKCARECPAGAIGTTSPAKQAIDETGNSGYLRWVIDHKKCFKYMSECGTNCNICIFVCSYNRGYKWTKSMFNSIKDNSTLIDNLLTTLDEVEPALVTKKKDNFWLKD